MNCATRRARGFVVQGDQLYHRVGQNYAGWWRAVVTNATGVHTTYGPYTTAITGDAIAWTSFGASPGWFGAPAGTNATPYRDIYNDRVAPVVALFRLMAAGDLGDSAVVDIDVNALNINTGAREVLSYKNLYASDFTGPAAGLFPLRFNVLPNYREYEYRVYWYGRGRVWQRSTKIYDPKTEACTW